MSRTRGSGQAGRVVVDTVLLLAVGGWFAAAADQVGPHLWSRR